MDSMNEILIRKLQSYFPPEDVEARIGHATSKNDDGTGVAKPLFYIPARRIQDRLDEVVGPLNWKLDFRKPVNRTEEEPAGVYAEISIRDPFTGEWVPKGDVSGNTATEGMKGGYSKAIVRAGVQWGIGRYLYRLTDEEVGWEDIKDNYGTWQFVETPQLPSRFHPRNNDGVKYTNEETRRLREAMAASDMEKKEVLSIFEEMKNEHGIVNVSEFTERIS